MSKTAAAFVAVVSFALIVLVSFAPAFAEDIPANYKLLYEQSCDNAEAMKDFVFSDPAAWRIGKDGKGEAALELFGKSDYTPKNRSPFNIALIRGLRVGDFRLEAELMSTVKPYKHQDMLIFFGTQSPEKFYYSHIAMTRDPLAHRVTIVNGAPRAAIPTEGNEGVKWEQNVWHKVRLDRNAGDGTIKVYFDDMTTPVQTANDKTFGVGYVGFGSFDDKGMIRDIKIYGASSEKGDADFFKAARIAE